MIYLDYAATTPMSDHALDIYSTTAKQYFANTQSLHDQGSLSKQLLENCRTELARLINGNSEGVYFTSGGSESNFLAITSLVNAYKHKGKHIVTTELEHSSVLNTIKKLANEGFEVSYVPVNGYGQVEISRLKDYLKPTTVLVSIGHANSEIGTIQNLKEIGKLLAERNILFHSDCVQTFLKLPIDIQDLHLSSISVSSHKLYGPKGVGACYVSPSLSWQPHISGTTHEKGFRPGTMNVPGITAFVTAANDFWKESCRIRDKWAALRDDFIKSVHSSGRIFVEGHPQHILPNIIGLRANGKEGQYVMLELNRKGIAVSTGSACSTGQQTPSRTLTAIGRSDNEARELVRISLGKDTTKEEIQTTANALLDLV